MEQKINSLINFVNHLGNKLKKLEDDNKSLREEIEAIKKKLSNL